MCIFLCTSLFKSRHEEKYYIPADKAVCMCTSTWAAAGFWHENLGPGREEKSNIKEEEDDGPKQYAADFDMQKRDHVDVGRKCMKVKCYLDGAVFFQDSSIACHIVTLAEGFKRKHTIPVQQKVSTSFDSILPK
jgi:hypothetical protein